MRYLILNLFFFISSASLQAADKYFTQYDGYFSNKQYKEALGVSKEWLKAQPNNPEAYIAVGNSYYGLGATEYSLVIGEEPKPDYSYEDTSLSSPPQNYSPSGKYDPVILGQTIQILETAINKFPNRLDIWFGLAYVHQQLEDFPGEYDVLSRCLLWAKDHSAQLKWSNETPVPEGPDKYIPGSIRDYADKYVHYEEKPNWVNYFKIAQLGVKYFPEDARAYDCVGNYFASHRNWSQALSYYLKADKRSPNESSILVHLGNCYSKTKEYSAAKKYFEKVIQLNKDFRDVHFSKEQLKKIDKMVKMKGFFDLGLTQSVK